MTAFAYPVENRVDMERPFSIRRKSVMRQRSFGVSLLQG